MSSLQSKELIQNISALLESARKKVAVAVNQAMVLTYFEIGRMIVEDEQNGENRAEYGKTVIKDLSSHLTERFGKGFSASNLQQMKQFYLSYVISQTVSVKLEILNNRIPQALSAEFEPTIFQALSDLSQIQQTTSANFNLSWSHYLKLMRIKDSNERKFYEIQSFKNSWSLRELQRQYNSALYTRLSLSKNKEEIIQLSEKGQTFEKAKDLIKEPYILEFLGLPEQSNCSENDLETGLIDENKTIGIILCQDKSEALVRYTLPEDNEQIFASKYMTVLSTKENFINILNSDNG